VKDREASKLPLSNAILRRPILWAAICFILGIAAHRAVLPHLPLQLTLAAALLLATFIFRRHALSALLLALAIFLLGLSRAQLESFYFPANHISRFTSDEPELAWVEMRIVSEPRVLAGAISFRPILPRQVALGEVTRILTHSGWAAASGKIRLSINDPHPQLEIRQTIRVIGMLSRPAPAINPGQYDWQAYDRDQRILANISVPHHENVAILAAPGPNLLDRLRLNARRALQLGFTDEQSLDHALLRALVLGDTDPQLRDVQDQFIRTGTSHHLAISGMHIAVLGMVVYFFCRLMFLSPRWAVGVGLSSALLYGLLALPSPPVVRSVILCVAFGLGPLLRKPTDALQLLALSVLAMLIYAPMDLYNAGFELSFGTVLGLIVFARPAMEWIASWKDPDLALAPPERSRSMAQRLGRWFKHKSIEAVATGIIAWLVSAPLIARSFSQLNPWAIPASILLAFPVFLALIGGIGKVVVSMVLPSASPWAAVVASGPVMVMRKSVEWLDHWPGGDRVSPPPSLWVMGVYYALLLLPLVPRGGWKMENGRWRSILHLPFSILFCAAPCIAVLLLLMPLLGLGKAANRRARFTLLAVGTGQCAVLQLPTGQAYVFDAGSAAPDLFHMTIAPAFKELGIRRVDGLFLSRPNPTAISAAVDLARMYEVDAVYLTPGFAADDHFTARQVLQGIGAPKIVVAGDRIKLGEGAEAQVLWPSQGEDASMVVRLSVGGHSILIAPDLPPGLSMVPAEVRVAHSQSLADEDVQTPASSQIVLWSDGTKRISKRAALDSARHYHTGQSGAITVWLASKSDLTVIPFKRLP
jgi:competence protein ComEC